MAHVSPLRVWLQAPEALRLARRCIARTQTLLDIELPLQHPDFCFLLSEYSELCDDPLLREDYLRLRAIWPLPEAAPRAQAEPLSKLPSNHTLSLVSP